MNITTKNYYPFISACLSIAIHLLILFVGGTILIQHARYNIQQGVDSTEIDLVSSLPTPIEIPSTIEEPKLKEAEPVPTVPKIKPLEQVKPKSKPSKPAHPIAKQSQPNVTGKSRASSRNQGAKISASPDYLRNPPPRYPEFARQAHQEGIVTLRVVVSEEGEPLSVIIKTSSGFQSLDNAALEAVRNWRFKPGTLAGVPVKSIVEVPVRFSLQK